MRPEEETTDQDKNIDDDFEDDCDSGLSVLELNLRDARRYRKYLRQFLEYAESGKPIPAIKAFSQLAYGEAFGGPGFAAAMRAIAKRGPLPDKTRLVFLRFYREHGDGIRQECRNDLDLIKGLRVLLPPYSGPALTLYRGQAAPGPKRRSYGLFWSTSREVADARARSYWRHHKEGSVVLRAMVAAEAIISRVTTNDDRFGEEEYIVDRRFLYRVRVLNRYAYAPVARRSCHSKFETVSPSAHN